MSLSKQKKKIFFGNCGNDIAENGKKKNLNGIMAMSFSKMGGKKKILLPKSRKKFLKKCYVHNIFIIFSQQITGDQLLLIQI